MATPGQPHSSRGEAPVKTPSGNNWKRNKSLHPSLLALLDLTDWIYFGLDSSGNLTEVSRRLAHLLSTTPDTLVGQPLTSLFSPPNDALLSEHLRQIGSPGAKRIRTDRLHLFLSLQSPYSVAIPVELVAVSTHSETASDRPVTKVVIEGLLRPVPPGIPSARPKDDAEGTHLTQAEQKYAQHLHTIAKIGQRVATSEDLDILMNHLVNILHQNLHYQYADVFTLNDEKTKATLRASAILTQESDARLSRETLNGTQFHIREQSVLAKVASNGGPILVNDVTSHPNDELLLQHPNVRSALVVPMIISERVAGVLVARSDAPDAFKDSDVVLMQILADQVAIAMENASLLSERDQRLAESAALNQIGTLLASPGELVDTLDAIIRRVNALFQVEAASLMLVENGYLHFKVAAGTHIEQIKPYSLEIGQGIAGWAVKHNQTVHVTDVTADPRHYPGIDQTISFGTRSLIAVPLRIAERPDDADPQTKQERVIGVIEIINRVDGRPFTRYDEVLLEFIASSAAIVIENVRLFNELQRRLSEMSALLDTSRAVATLELQAVLDTIVEHVSTTLDAELAFVYLLDDKVKRLVPRATNLKLQAANLGQMVFGVGRGTVGKIAETGQALHIDDAQSDPRFLRIGPFSDRVKCTLGVPLLVQGKLIGVLEVANKQNQKQFTPADEELLSAFAGQVALAIHNARLYREIERRVEALAALGRASAAINRAMRLDEILDSAVEAATAMVPSNQGVALMLQEAHNGELRVVAQQGFDQAALDALKLSTTVDLEYQRSSLISDSSAPDVRIVDAQDPVPLIGVPLRGREQVLGLIVLGTTTPPQETSRLLQTLGDMVAIAIEKARLHEETSRRLAEVSTLYTLANQITTVLDLDRILDTTVTIINRALDCQGSCLHLHDRQTGELTLKASSSRGRREQEVADLELIDQVSRYVLSQRQPINLTNIKSQDDISEILSADTRQNTATPSEEVKSMEVEDTLIRSLLVVPLVTQNAFIGTLSIDDQAPEAFGPSEGRLLTIAAAQVSVAIENARLLRNLHDRAIQLERALEELRELHRLKTEFVQNLSHELRTPLTFVKSYVQLILDGAMGEINSDVEGALVIVDERTDAVTHLVNDVLSLEQVEMGRLELQPISLAQVAARSVDGAAMTAKKSNVNIQLQADDDLPLVNGDEGRLGQVFDNFLGNAIKFSPAGSSITVRVWRDGTYVRAEVEDQGIGIPADKLEHIFDRFFQVDGSTTRRYAGTGLGLAIVKSIVESHSGQVSVDSKEGVGSTFSFFLPILTAEEANH